MAWDSEPSRRSEDRGRWEGPMREAGGRAREASFEIILMQTEKQRSLEK